MNRRKFFKPLIGGVVGGALAQHSLSQESSVRDHAAAVPRTPFDAPAGSWTLAVFPDSQSLTKLDPDVFVRQAEWVAAHRESHNIRFVAHLGDITDNNLPEQWRNAKKAMDVLKQAGVPYSLLPGNHDLGAGGKCLDRSTLMNEFFSPGDYVNSGGVIYFETGRLENTVHTFPTPHGDFLVVALEFGPRDEVIGWADKLIAEHPSHTVIVTTHAYMYFDDTRYDFSKHGTAQTWNPNTYGVAKLSAVNDAESIWRKLLSRHANIRFMLSGHVLNDGTGLLTSTGKDGAKVHQILSNYQMGVKPDRPFHGGGYFRLMQFLPDKKTVRVRTYSPWLDQWFTDASQQFELVL